MGDSGETDLGSGASAFVVMDALPLANSGDRLAGEACDVQVNGGVVNDSGLGPGILSDFEGVEVMPDKLSGIGLVLRGTD